MEKTTYIGCTSTCMCSPYVCIGRVIFGKGVGWACVLCMYCGYMCWFGLGCCYLCSVVEIRLGRCGGLKEYIKCWELEWDLGSVLAVLLL